MTSGEQRRALLRAHGAPALVVDEITDTAFVVEPHSPLGWNVTALRGADVRRVCASVDSAALVEGLR